ncbi:glycosyltransferase [Bacillus halotolerans]|uniref:glycosyltransferase n=2 Tax=Bacillus halotolerans TaxID=260554 RepID=UPI002E13335C
MMLKISVAVPCYNSEPFIGRCIESLVNQSLADNEYEIICIDDKSTDRTAEVLKEYGRQYTHVKVIERTENSGGPGKPRNQAIDVAKGKYIFFVDSDDYLGEEALERLYNYAEENHSDIVLGKMKGVNGRPVPVSIFKETNPNVDLVDSNLVYSMGPTKLFRVSMLRENNITFPSDIQATEDQVFVMNAYVHAQTISVLADYNYYYAVSREGNHMTFAYVPPKDYYGAMEAIISIIKKSSLSEERKKQLTAKFLNRHFQFSRTTDFTSVIESEEEQKNWMHHLHLFIQKNILPCIDNLLLNHIRLRLFFIRKNDFYGFKQLEQEEANIHKFAQVEGKNIIVNYPSVWKYNLSKEALVMNYKNTLIHFVNEMKIQQEYFVISGSIYHSALKNQSDEQRLVGVWVHRKSKEEKRFIPTKTEGSHFVFSFPFNDMAKDKADIGIWDFFIESSINGYTKRARIGHNRNPYPYENHAKYVGNNGLYAYSMRPYFTKHYDNLSLELKRQGALQVEFTKEDCNKLLAIDFPNQQLFFPSSSKLLFEVDHQEFLVPVKEIVIDENRTIIKVKRHHIQHKFQPGEMKHGYMKIFINSYQTLLKPLDKRYSAFFCSGEVEKKLLFFKLKKKVDYVIISDQSKFYLTAR